MYQVQIIWNRGFHWVSFGKPFTILDDAKNYATELINMGDGARVKKAQVINLETDELVLKSHQIH